ncbi:MAG: hypothetical protein E7487_01190 [Ruminococcaceae bacterium]|nr:hypothetical protein [Oscillospiraceae bacterium]
MDYREIQDLCMKYGLGNLQAGPEKVTGGLLHKMYHIKTNCGEYALKVLKPDIMRRPGAYDNMVNSERVAQLLKDRIPLIGAKCLNGKNLIERNKKYCFVYEWIEGKSVFVPEISDEHCKKIGEILGKIHAADVCLDGLSEEQDSRSAYDWKRLLREAEQTNNPCFCTIEQWIEKLEEWDEKVITYQKEVKSKQVISHRDLDPKNVMWSGEMPCVIDWEAAGYIPPYQELLAAIYDWTTNENGEYDDRKIMALLTGYTEFMNISHVNWDAFFAVSFDGRLGWLEYCVRKVLGEEEPEQKEVQDKIEQINKNLFELEKCEKEQQKIRRIIEKV